MFKKVFLAIICGIFLWGILSNTTGGLTPYTMPEYEVQIDKNIGERGVFPYLEKIELIKKELDAEYYPMDNAKKNEIIKESEEIKSEAEEILSSMEEIEIEQ